MVAFANNKGGYIVFGIKDKPRELVGLQSNNFETTDEAKITAYFNDVFSPKIVFEKFIVEVRSKNIGVLYTHQAKCHLGVPLGGFTPKWHPQVAPPSGTPKWHRRR